MKRVAVVLAMVTTATSFGCGLLDGALVDVVGVWGARHVELQATAQGARFEYDCAEGVLEQPIVLDSAFAFTAIGSHRPLHGGPDRSGEPSPSYRARYDGRLVRGGLLEVTVTLLDTTAVIGPFQLQRDRPGLLFRCK